MVELTKLSKEDFESILSNYSVGSYKKHKHIFAGENTIYRLTTTKGRFILKIYEKSPRSFVDYQVALMEFLRNTKVKTPKVILTKKKEGLLLWKSKRIVLQEFAEGKTIESVNKSLARDMGSKYSLLDKTLESFKKRNSTSGWWGEQFKLIRWPPSVEILGINPLQESKKLLKEINNLDKAKLRKRLIHSDLCEGNFLVRNNKISAILDWDDVHEDCLVYELAIPIAHNMTTTRRTKKKVIKVFLAEYQKRTKLNEEEKKALYYFIKHRELSAGVWCYDQIKRHPDRKKEMLKWTKICIKKYKAFSKLSLEDFLQIAK